MANEKKCGTCVHLVCVICDTKCDLDNEHRGEGHRACSDYEEE